MEIAEETLAKLTAANFELFKEKLTLAGEKMVEATVGDLARDLAYFLKGRKPFDYEQLRQDEVLRFIATQDIYYDGMAVGYFWCSDHKGEIIWHPIVTLKEKTLGNGKTNSCHA